MKLKWKNKRKARSAREVVMEKGQDSFIEDFYDKHGVTKFTGYEKTEDEATLLSSREAKDGKYLLILIKLLSMLNQEDKLEIKEEFIQITSQLKS